MGFDLQIEEEAWANEDREWVGLMDGLQKMRSIQLDASTFSPAHVLAKGFLPSGTSLRLLSNGKFGPYLGNAAVNEVQVITESDGTDGGTFTITFTVPSGATFTTGAIAWDATAADMMAAIEASDLFDIDDVVVVRSAGAGGAFVYTLTFGGQYAGMDMPAVTTDNSLTTDGGVQENDAITTTTPGVAGMAGHLGTSTKLGNGTGTDLATAGDPSAPLYWSGLVYRDKLPTFSGTNEGELDADAERAMTHIRYENWS